MSARPTLYSFRRCPYAMRARLALLASGTVCELREVKLSAKPPEMLALSPKGTVPVLLTPQGGVIDESLDIMRWALDRNDPLGWLEGDGPESDALLAANDGPFKQHLDRYKYPERHNSRPQEHREAGLRQLGELDAHLRGTAFLLGDAPRLADYAIFPFVRQFALTDRDWFDAQALPGLQRWLAALLASDLFAQAMLRVPPWQPGEVVSFGPEGAL